MAKVAKKPDDIEKCGSCGSAVIRARDERAGRNVLVEEVAPGAGRFGLELPLTKDGTLPKVYKTGARTRFKLHRCRTEVPS